MTRCDNTCPLSASRRSLPPGNAVAISRGLASMLHTQAPFFYALILRFVYHDDLQGPNQDQSKFISSTLPRWMGHLNRLTFNPIISSFPGRVWLQPGILVANCALHTDVDPIANVHTDVTRFLVVVQKTIDPH